MHQPHIHDYKRKEVEDVKRLFSEYPVVGIVNMENLPASTLQLMKKSLRQKAEIKITRKRFMEIAIDNIKDKPHIHELKEKLEGIPALLFTKEEPFALYKLLEKSKTQAPAKPGQKAPFDITIQAGPTPFTPGPMIGELGQLGIKTEVKEGKINVKEDKLIVKEGDTITPKVAELLSKLSIEPMREGLNLLLTYSNGEILTAKVLHVDEELYRNNVKKAYSQSLSLAMYLGIVNTDTIKPLVQKAHNTAKFLAEKYNILTPETIGKQLLQAERAAELVKQKLPDMPQPSTTPEQHPSPQEQPKPAPPPQPPPGPLPQVTSASLSPSQPIEPAIEIKEPIKPSDMEVAEKFLKELTEKTIKVEGSKKVDPRIHPQQDINNLINQLKDKKSRGEL